MTIRHQRSVGLGLIGAAAALALSGCAHSAAPARPGELRVQVDPEASYSLVGRFHLNAVEPWSPSRDIDFDSATSTAHLDLSPGTYSLALAPGARLVCAGEDPEHFAEPFAGVRLVSASPRLISIVPGGITTAHVRFGAPPWVPGADDPITAASGAAPLDADPCGTRVEVVARR
jgi:hypothetical protein